MCVRERLKDRDRLALLTFQIKETKLICLLLLGSCAIVVKRNAIFKKLKTHTRLRRPVFLLPLPASPLSFCRWPRTDRPRQSSQGPGQAALSPPHPFPKGHQRTR